MDDILDFGPGSEKYSRFTGTLTADASIQLVAFAICISKSEEWNRYIVPHMMFDTSTRSD